MMLTRLETKIHALRDYVKYLLDEREANEVCDKCRSSVRLRNGVAKLRCTKQKCGIVTDAYNFMVFHNIRNNFLDVILVYEMWVNGATLTFISVMTGIKVETLSKYIAGLKIILSVLVEEANIMIGGHDIIVEVDESKFGKRKYNRGRRIKGTWVVGLVERTPERKIVLIPVMKRDKETLHAIVEKYVRKDSIIFSDGWKGYMGLKDMGYEHATVIHDKQFKEWSDELQMEVHTNTIEGNWGSLKRMCPAVYRTEDLISAYLNLYTLRRLYGKGLFAVILRRIFLK